MINMINKGDDRIWNLKKLNINVNQVKQERLM